MNELNTAIYSKLNVSSLTTLLSDGNSPTSIFNKQAPDEAAFPFVVFNKQSDTEGNDTRHRVIDTIYQVRGFTKSTNGEEYTIAAAIDALLHNATLTITGFAQLRLVRIGGIDFVENQQSTDKVFSAGSLFRLIVEKTS